MTKFSIIIATKNASSTIDAALDSIQRQSYQSLEIIMIDGASTDGTVELARSKIPAIKITSEPDNGIYDALNKGIRRATGEWVYVLGADDILKDDRVLADVASCTDGPLSMIYGNIEVIKGERKRLIRMLAPDVYRKIGLDAPPIFHQAAFLKRVYLPLPCSFPLRFRIHADYWLMSKVFVEGHSRHLDRTICSYKAGGASHGSLKTWWRSAQEQWAIGDEFGGRRFKLVKALSKNFVRSIVNDYGPGVDGLRD